MPVNEENRIDIRQSHIAVKAEGQTIKSVGAAAK
jgi:hypothetical protein